MQNKQECLLPIAGERYKGVLTFYQRDMGWLRLVGSLQLQVSFAKVPCQRDEILQKRPIILRSLLMEATPCLPPLYKSTFEGMGWLQLVDSLKLLTLFCSILSLLYGSFAKETYYCKEPTNRSHPIYPIAIAFAGAFLKFSRDCVSHYSTNAGNQIF